MRVFGLQDTDAAIPKLSVKIHAAMKKLFGQLLVPPALSILALKILFSDWWDSVGMRSRWSVWILLSAGLLLLFQFAWATLERHQPRKQSASRPGSNGHAGVPRPILIKKAPAPLKKVPPTPPLSVDEGAMSYYEEQRILAAARRALTGECERVELYRNRGKLVVREVRSRGDEVKANASR